MLQSGHGSRDRRTDRRTDGRTEWNQYTPQQLCCSGAIIRCSGGIISLKEKVISGTREKRMATADDKIHYRYCNQYFLCETENIQKEICIHPATGTINLLKMESKHGDNLSKTVNLVSLKVGSLNGSSLLSIYGASTFVCLWIYQYCFK